MHEGYERLAIRHHKSYLPHGAIFKLSRDILAVGDLWVVSSATLELQNAETKRVAEDMGARRLTLAAAGQNRSTARGADSSEYVAHTTKGYSTTLVFSRVR